MRDVKLKGLRPGLLEPGDVLLSYNNIDLRGRLFEYFTKNVANTVRVGQRNTVIFLKKDLAKMT